METTTITFTLSEKLKNELKKTSEENGIKYSEIIRRGIINQIKELN